MRDMEGDVLVDDVVVEDGEDHENEVRIPRVTRPPREPSRQEKRTA